MNPHPHDMDLSDIGRSTPPPEEPATSADHARWHSLIAEMGAEIAQPLTAAIERINTLASTGRITRDSLRALRDEVEQARQTAMRGQQLARFASGRLRHSHERLPLADVMAGVIAHRARETQARGIHLRPSLNPADVLVDASLLFSLLNTTLDWALANAESQIDFAVALTPAPVHALLSCRFAHRPLDMVVDGPAASVPAGLDSLAWRLIEQTAWTMGLVVDRREDGATTTLTLDFPRTANTLSEAVSALELNDGFALSSNSQPLAGNHVLVIASRREMRVAIRDALRGMSLIIDFVNSVDEATAFCAEGLPHAVIIEAIQVGERFGKFRAEILDEVPGFAFIEIIEEGSAFEMSGFGGNVDAMARVGRDVLASSLPSALMFELAKGE